MKKLWKKPKLVVLYRGKPEESVLAACKADMGGSPPGPAFNKCKNRPPDQSPCNLQAVS